MVGSRPKTKPSSVLGTCQQAFQVPSAPHSQTRSLGLRRVSSGRCSAVGAGAGRLTDAHHVLVANCWVGPRWLTVNKAPLAQRPSRPSCLAFHLSASSSAPTIAAHLFLQNSSTLAPPYHLYPTSTHHHQPDIEQGVVGFPYAPWLLIAQRPGLYLLLQQNNNNTLNVPAVRRRQHLVATRAKHNRSQPWLSDTSPSTVAPSSKPRVPLHPTSSAVVAKNSRSRSARQSARRTWQSDEVSAQARTDLAPLSVLHPTATMTPPLQSHRYVCIPYCNLVSGARLARGTATAAASRERNALARPAAGGPCDTSHPSSPFMCFCGSAPILVRPTLNPSRTPATSLRPGNTPGHLGHRDSALWLESLAIAP